MSETIVGILGFLTIAAIVVTLFKSKTLPSIAFIVFPTILAVILVIGGYYDFEQVGKLIKSGFSSTSPTAALFVFSVLSVSYTHLTKIFGRNHPGGKREKEETLWIIKV